MRHDRNVVTCPRCQAREQNCPDGCGEPSHSGFRSDLSTVAGPLPHSAAVVSTTVTWHLERADVGLEAVQVAAFAVLGNRNQPAARPGHLVTEPRWPRRGTLRPAPGPERRPEPDDSARLGMGGGSRKAEGASEGLPEHRVLFSKGEYEEILSYANRIEGPSMNRDQLAMNLHQQP